MNGAIERGGPGPAPRLRPVLLIVFALVAALLVGALLLVFSTIEAERSERAQTQRTNAGLAAIRDVTRAALNAETGQRGYLLTRDERYLAPYRLASQSYPEAIARLKTVIRQNGTPQQRALVDRMDGLANGKFQEMAHSIALTRQGRLIDAQQLLLSDGGLVEMDAMREAASELERTELHLLNRATTQSRAAEGRVLPLLGLLLLLMLGALALGFTQLLRTARVEAQAANAAEIADARDRADLLARELNHRVKNLFAVILAIVRLTGRDSAEAKPVVDKITSRIEALIAAHDITQGASDHQVIDLRALIETAIRPYSSDTERCEIRGEPVRLSAKMAVPLGLVIHELVTNAVKYGAWSAPGGLVEVNWTARDRQVELTWREHASKPIEPPGDRAGFGSMLIRSSSQQLGGSIERTFQKFGIVVTFRFAQAEPDQDRS